jgi:cbb3-type cytochrome c oxidase subunit III
MSFFLTMLLAIVLLIVPNTAVSQTAGDVAAGGSTFKSYCATCHGDAGQGNGPAAVALNPKPRDLSDKNYMDSLNDDHLKKVIKQGGGSVGKSPLMPALGAGFSKQQVTDLIAFIRSLSAPVAENQVTVSDKVLKGQTIFKTYCATCHGDNGQGDGPAAVALNPKPANFSDFKFISQRDDAHLTKVIKGGGVAVGKSPLMPALGAGFTDQQVGQVIAFIRSISDAKLASGKELFETYCVSCHGESGVGDGKAAASLKTKPRNLTDAAYMDKLDDKHIAGVLKKGGASVGKSAQMHSMGAGLNEQQISDLISYLRKLSSN